MNRQANALLAFVGGAVMLLGCTQDPIGTAPGGLEPSASSQQSEDRDDTSPGGGAGNGPSGGESSQSGEGPGDANERAYCAAAACAGVSSFAQI
jgi:hypothetical protein